MSTGAAKTAQRSGALDGLRGLAALAVLLMHVVVSMRLLPFNPLGGMGVLMFFALSGYLIAGICWRGPATWKYYRNFLRRRVQRLAPVNLALVLIGGPILVAFGALPMNQVATDSIFALTQTSAFAIARGLDMHESFAPTWSLTVEWVFYLILPLSIIVAKRIGVSARSVSWIFATTAVILYLGGLVLDFRSFYLLPVANLGIMFAGGALSLNHSTFVGDQPNSDSARSLFGLALLVTFIFLPGYTLGWGYKVAVLPATTVATLAVIHGCWAGNKVRQILDTSFLRAIGLRAYSLYLWHMPVLWLAWVNLAEWDKFLRAAVGLACLAPVVWLSFRLLEEPVLKSRAPIPSQSLNSLTA